MTLLRITHKYVRYTNPYRFPCTVSDSCTCDKFTFEFLTFAMFVIVDLRTVCHGTAFPLFGRYRNETGNEVQIFCGQNVFFPTSQKLPQPSYNNVQKAVIVQCCRNLSSWVTVLLLSIKLVSWPCLLNVR